jgi:hypothetical protein
MKKIKQLTILLDEIRFTEKYDTLLSKDLVKLILKELKR